jgi:hypothetical protein
VIINIVTLCRRSLSLKPKVTETYLILKSMPQPACNAIFVCTNPPFVRVVFSKAFLTAARMTNSCSGLTPDLVP